LEQCGEHFLNLEQLRLHSKVLSFFDHFQITGEQKEILQFAGRAHGRVEKLAQFCFAPPPTPFRDVGWDGACRPTNLTAHTETLVGRQLPGYRIYLQHECMATAPHIEFTEVLHDAPLFVAQESNLLITNHLELITEIITGGGYVD